MRCYRDYCSNNYRLVLVSEPDGVLENAGTEYFSCGFGRGVAEKKYGELYKDEKENLLKRKDILLDLKTQNNGIDEVYRKMSNMYEFIEDY